MRAALTLCVLGTFVLLAGCAGREANPEPTQWVYDKYYGCKDIRAEKDRIAEAMRDRNIEQVSLESRDNDLMARTIPFLAPGVDHCGASGPTISDADALAALTRWVEHGQAPATLPAAGKSPTGVDVSHPVCSYPNVARWSGAGYRCVRA